MYIDPWKLKNPPKADIILVTHAHYDHLSLNDIEEIQKENTVIVCTEEASKELKGINVKKVKPGEKFDVQGIKISAVPSYNIGKDFHKKEDNNAGYVLEIDGEKLYHAGDTDFIPEMKELKGIDVALVPVGGTYTMNPQEAAEAVQSFNPGTAVPMHWGIVVGSKKDAEEFKKLCKVKVVILPEENG